MLRDPTAAINPTPSHPRSPILSSLVPHALRAATPNHLPPSLIQIQIHDHSNPPPATPPSPLPSSARPTSSSAAAVAPSSSGRNRTCPAPSRGFLSPSLRATPKTRSLLTAAGTSTPASVSTVGDLRGLAASSLDSLKRRVDALHADNARDLEASHSRISKRIKMQTQSCVQMAEEAEKEHKKMVDKVSQQAEEMKASYKKLVTEVQSSSSHVCKVTLPEMAKSVARAIDGLRSGYNIPATIA